MPIQGETLKPAKNVKHQLVGELHKPIIVKLYSDLYLVANITPKLLRQRAYKRFKQLYPNVKCTLQEFSQFAQNQGIPSVSPIKNEAYRDYAMELIKFHYRPNQSKRTSRIVYDLCKEAGKYCTLDYIKSLYDEYATDYGLKIIPNNEFSAEWEESYDSLLMSYYLDEDSCGIDSVEKYIDKFNRHVGKKFSRRLVQDRLLTILFEPKAPTKVKIDSIPPHLIETIKANLEDFVRRNLSYPVIAQKIQFWFSAEGYESTIDDINNLLQSLNFTTN